MMKYDDANVKVIDLQTHHWPYTELKASGFVALTAGTAEVSSAPRLKAEQETLEIPPSGLMQINDVAKYLGRNLNAVRDMRRKGRLPFSKLGGRLVIKKAKLDAAINDLEEMS